MATYSVARAQDNLSELIDHARLGESVVVTRHGTPVVEFKAVNRAADAITDADLQELAARRIEPCQAIQEHAGSRVSRMRDAGIVSYCLSMPALRPRMCHAADRTAYSLTSSSTA